MVHIPHVQFSSPQKSRQVGFIMQNKKYAHAVAE